MKKWIWSGTYFEKRLGWWFFLAFLIRIFLYFFSNTLPVLLLVPPTLFAFGRIVREKVDPIPYRALWIAIVFSLFCAALDVGVMMKCGEPFYDKVMFPDLRWQLILRSLIFKILAYNALIFIVWLGWKSEEFRGRTLHSLKDIHYQVFFREIIRVAVWLIGGFALFFFSENLRGEKGVIEMGSTDWSFSDSVDIRSILKEEVSTGAERLLGSYSKEYEFDLKVVKRPYSNLVGAVLNDRVDIGIVSPYTYLFHHEKGDSLFRSRSRLIGRKYSSYGLTYTPGFILNKKYKDSLTTAEDIFKKDRNLKLLISDEELSTSTRVIPLIAMIDHGQFDVAKRSRPVSRQDMLDMLQADKDSLGKADSLHLNFSSVPKGVNQRHEMEDKLDLIRKVHVKSVKVPSDTIVLGVSTSDQWEFMKKKDPGLYFIPLEDYKIPYDPVVVNREQWEWRFKNPFDALSDFIRFKTFPLWRTREDIILDALRGIVKKTEDENEWIDSNTVFVQRVSSWLVKPQSDSIRSDSTSISLLIPRGEFDITGSWSVSQNDSLRFFRVDTNEELNRNEYVSASYPYRLVTNDSLVILPVTPPDSSGMKRTIGQLDQYYFEAIMKTRNKIPLDSITNSGWHILPERIFIKWQRQK